MSARGVSLGESSPVDYQMRKMDSESLVFARRLTYFVCGVLLIVAFLELLKVSPTSYDFMAHSIVAGVSLITMVAVTLLKSKHYRFSLSFTPSPNVISELIQTPNIQSQFERDFERNLYQFPDEAGFIRACHAAWSAKSYAAQAYGILRQCTIDPVAFAKGVKDGGFTALDQSEILATYHQQRKQAFESYLKTLPPNAHPYLMQGGIAEFVYKPLLETYFPGVVGKTTFRQVEGTKDTNSSASTYAIYTSGTDTLVEYVQKFSMSRSGDDDEAGSNDFFVIARSVYNITKRRATISGEMLANPPDNIRRYSRVRWTV